jgi:hypothetical protein
MIDRDAIIDAVRAVLEPRDDVDALWEAGSAAWGRVDEWSDVDLLAVVADDAVAGVIGAIDAALAELSPIETRFELPQPTWHGHDQVFYRLRDTTEFLVVDLAVMRRSAPGLFNEGERHGAGRVLFDRTGVADPIPLDRAEHDEGLQRKLAQIRQTFPLFQFLVKKEMNRGNALGAIAFYNGHVLAPLMTLVRMRWCPDRFDYGPRYAVMDLPADVAADLQPLWFVRDLDDLAVKQARAVALFEETLRAIDEAG